MVSNGIQGISLMGTHNMFSRKNKKNIQNFWLKKILSGAMED